MKNIKNIILILIIVIVIFFLLAIILTGGVGGYQVTIKGTVFYDIINGWGVTYDGKTVEEASVLFWYWPWETKDVTVEVEMVNTITKNSYSGQLGIGTLSSIVGSKSFDVTCNHIPQGRYSTCIRIYEVDKGFLGLGEASRSLKATCCNTLVIE